MPTIPSVTRDLVNIRAELERVDKSLEIYSYQKTEARNRHGTYPNQSYVDNVRDIGRRLNKAAVRFSDVAPGAEGIAEQLDNAAQHVAEKAGRIGKFADDRTSFGSGWGETFDGDISAVARAIDYLLDQMG